MTKVFIHEPELSTKVVHYFMDVKYGEDELGFSINVLKTYEDYSVDVGLVRKGESKITEKETNKLIEIIDVAYRNGEYEVEFNI